MGSVQSILSLKRIVENEAKRQPVIVVVSALSGITDKLISTAMTALRHDDHWKREFDAMVDRHHKMIDTIITDNKKREDLFNRVDSLFEQLRSIYYGVYLIHDLSQKTQDTIVSYGERLSSNIVATLIGGAKWFDARKFIKTERKNNTGTGRTSINVVLSGRCDLIAPAGGKVLLVEKLPNVGNTLVIEHGAGVKTIYYGLRRLTVEKGAIVAQGDALGTTDKATVVEVRVGKTPVEPLRILRGQCDALRSY